jgi:hypothetical protein
MSISWEIPRLRFFLYTLYKLNAAVVERPETVECFTAS